MRYALLVLFGLLGLILLAGCTQQQAPATANPQPSAPQAQANTSANPSPPPAIPAGTNITVNPPPPAPPPSVNITAGASAAADTNQSPIRCIGASGSGSTVTVNGTAYHVAGTMSFNGVNYQLVACPNGTSCDSESGACK